MAKISIVIGKMCGMIIVSKKFSFYIVFSIKWAQEKEDNKCQLQKNGSDCYCLRSFLE